MCSVVLYILIFICLDRKLEEKRFCLYYSKHSTVYTHKHTHTHTHARTVQNLQKLKHTFPACTDLALTRKSWTDLNLVQHSVGWQELCLATSDELCSELRTRDTFVQSTHIHTFTAQKLCVPKTLEESLAFHFLMSLNCWPRREARTFRKKTMNTDCVTSISNVRIYQITRGCIAAYRNSVSYSVGNQQLDVSCLPTERSMSDTRSVSGIPRVNGGMVRNTGGEFLQHFLLKLLQHTGVVDAVVRSSPPVLSLFLIITKSF
jgi:hypothetical protein